MWNLKSSNRICEDRLIQDAYSKHVKSLSNIKPTIDNRTPYCPPFLKTRAKQYRIAEDRKLVIDTENQMLLDRILEISKRKTSLSPSVLIKNYVPPQQMNTKSKLERLRLIDIENKGILKRLQSNRSVYDREKFAKDNEAHERFKLSISRHSNRVRSSDQSQALRNSTASNGLKRSFFLIACQGHKHAKYSVANQFYYTLEIFRIFY
eukprot:TRINITY_DN4753_c0_g2_i3.p1 TRINITY_DN4753_c0_g2~~TRINITY_DN4753_c0_g2_i3.p1  ORF type:complete len:207 (+),score=11.28 TRINITY_DN4753_c0_g2_i3:87-707(+)